MILSRVSIAELAEAGVSTSEEPVSRAKSVRMSRSLEPDALSALIY